MPQPQTEFGIRLSEMLAKKGMNQSDLSRASGTDRGQINQYINGKTQPGAAAAAKLAAALGCSVEDLMGNGRHQQPSAVIEILDDGQAILKVAAKMDLKKAVEIAAMVGGEKKR